MWKQSAILFRQNKIYVNRYYYLFIGHKYVFASFYILLPIFENYINFVFLFVFKFKSKVSDCIIWWLRCTIDAPKIIYFSFRSVCLVFLLFLIISYASLPTSFCVSFFYMKCPFKNSNMDWKSNETKRPTIKLNFVSDSCI